VAPRPASDGMRIGEMARLVGVSERTLRYYEELGLVMATRQNPRGSRHYDEVQVARVLRIKELQGLLGFNLLEISTILQAQDRIDELRGELAEHDDAPSRRQILQEGCASRAVSADVQASWRASPNSWARSTNRWRAPRPYSRAWTRQRPPHPPGLRRPQSDLLRHSRPKRRGDSGRERRERRVVEAMGLGNRLTGDGTPHDVDALGKAGSSSTAWRQPPAAMASV